MLFEWQAYGLLAVAASTLYYVFAREGKRMNIPVQALLTVSFAITVAISVYLAKISQINLGLRGTVPFGAILILAAICCCLAGNLSEMRGIFNARNPGYCLAITKSNAALVLVASVILFHGEWSITKTVGVGTIIIAQAVIVRQSY